MELEITWERTIRIWWSYAWRSLIAMVVAMLIAFIVGFIIAFVMKAVGISTATIKLFSATSGFIIGIAISVVPIKMILGKDFGEFRLVLVSKLGSQTGLNETT